MIDNLDATDEASRMFATAWVLCDWSSLQTPQAPEIRYEGRTTDTSPPTDAPYVRFTVTPTTSKQGSLSGDTGKIVWTNFGIINVQSFAPLQWASAYEAAQYSAIMAKRVYQGNASPNGMWFRNCRETRVGPSGGWYQFNTLIEYQYDELR